MHRCENAGCLYYYSRGSCQVDIITRTELGYTTNLKNYRSKSADGEDTKVSPEVFRVTQILSIIKTAEETIDTLCRPEDQLLRDTLQKFVEETAKFLNQ